DELVMSPDGAWLAYTGRPWVPGGDARFDFVLIDAARGVVAFEKLLQESEVTISEIVAANGRYWLLAAMTKTSLNRDERSNAVWLDGTARQATPQAAVQGTRLIWLPWRRRVVSEYQCA